MSGIEAAMFGALGRDAEAKTSKTGKHYLRMNIRVGDGDTAQWINATVFDTKAIEAADRLVKGTRIYLEGRSRRVVDAGRRQASRLVGPVLALPPRTDRTQQAGARSRIRRH
jgi:single-stranded DNA-binding protein